MLQCNRELLSTVSLFFLLVLWEFDPVKCYVLNFNETFILSNFYILVIGNEGGGRLRVSYKLLF